MEQRTSLTEIIEHINPSELTYQEWCSVGMALSQAFFLDYPYTFHLVRI